MPSFTVYAALLVTMTVWGLSFIGTKIALESFPPFSVMFYRFALASLVFLPILLKRGLPRLDRGTHLRLLLLSICEPCLYFVCETYGIRLTSASKTSLIIALVPVAVAVLSRLVLKERLSGKSGIGIAFSILGTILLVLGGGGFEGGGESLAGDLLAFGAVVSAAFYMVFARDLGRKVPALTLTAIQCLYGAVFFAPFHFFGVAEALPISSTSAAAILFLALGATFAGFLCNNYALSKIPASRAAVFINGIPVVTTLAAWFILGERLSALQIAGAITVVASVSLTASEIEKTPAGGNIASWEG